MEMAPDELWLAQRPIYPLGQDIRAVVVRDGAEHRLVTAMERTGEGFHANISQGGSGRRVELHPNDARTATETARVLGLDFAGVDLMGVPGSQQVIEANSGLGLVVEKITNIPVADHIAATALQATAASRAALRAGG